MFIGPVHGKRKPQLAYPDVMKQETNTIQNLEVLEKNDEAPNHALDLITTRIEKIVKRPKKPGSKV